MKTITLRFSDGAYDFLEQEAKVKNMSVQELVESFFIFYEHNYTNPDTVEKHIKNAKKVYIDKISNEAYKKHPLQHYILEYYNKSRKEIKKSVSWRTCPVQENSIAHKDHIGEYAVTITTYKNTLYGGFIREIKSQHHYYVKTLKALKRKVNTIMGYDHYKVK